MKNLEVYYVSHKISQKIINEKNITSY